MLLITAVLGFVSLAAMSATIVFGFFALSGGQRVQTTKPDGSSKTYHCLYDTTIQCPSGAIFPAQLRIYSPFHDTPLADDTIAFVLARPYIPTSIPKDAILLEASNVVAVPGDPSSEEYESRVPDSPWPYVFGLGTVSSRAITLPDGASKAFSVVSSDYVRDANMTSTVVCTIDSSHPRWRRTPVPNQNSMVFYSGHFSGAAAGGGITVGLKNITLYVGGRNNGTNMTAASGSRKRKFMSTLSQEYASSFLNVVSLNGNSGETTGIVPPEKLSPTIGCVCFYYCSFIFILFFSAKLPRYLPRAVRLHLNTPESYSILELK
ncbi:hypothetical protein BKA82DRAFT_544335 [Pisolithus tinctorius]|nr:hypothetical protein BKA82DRAFT_544335 [Pisolithus tinctorius]